MLNRNHRRSRSAFTLIELLLVMVILGVLAAIIVPNYAGRIPKAKIEAAKQDISAMANALATFEVDNGRYPTNDEGLGPRLLQSTVQSGRDLAWALRHQADRQGSLGQSVHLSLPRLPQPARVRPALHGSRRPGRRHRRHRQLVSREVEGNQELEMSLTPEYRGRASTALRPKRPNAFVMETG